MPNPADKLRLARRHLERVQAAWDTPTDWDDLSIYGLYCLEAPVEAAATHVGLMTSKKHWEKADIAGELHKKHGFPTLDNCSVISTMRGRLQLMVTFPHQAWMRRTLPPRSSYTWMRWHSFSKGNADDGGEVPESDRARL